MAATLPPMSAQLAVVSSLSRITFGRSTMTTSSRGRTVRMAAAPKRSSGPAIDKMGDKVANKIKEAQEICEGDNQSEECAAAWDAVESATAEKANIGPVDPLDEYCKQFSEADECRIYKD